MTVGKTYKRRILSSLDRNDTSFVSSKHRGLFITSLAPWTSLPTAAASLEERARRLAEGRCYRCGGAGHMVRGVPRHNVRSNAGTDFKKKKSGVGEKRRYTTCVPAMPPATLPIAAKGFFRDSERTFLTDEYSRFINVLLQAIHDPYTSDISQHLPTTWEGASLKTNARAAKQGVKPEKAEPRIQMLHYTQLPKGLREVWDSIIQKLRLEL